MSKCGPVSSYHLIAILILFQPLHSTQGSASGVEIEKTTERLLESERLGVAGLLTTSPATVFFYQHLSEVFDSALEESKGAARIVEMYENQMPQSRAQWGQCMSAYDQVLASRERYQDALREVVVERRPVVERLMLGGISGTSNKLSEIASKQSSLLAAVADVHNQLLKQKTRVAQGRAPEILWPSNLPPELRDEIEFAMKQQARAGWTSTSWEALERRIQIIRRGEEEEAELLRQAARDSWEHLSEMESRAFAELNVLAEAQVDLAINSVFQEVTIGNRLLVQRWYQLWRDEWGAPEGEMPGAARDVKWAAVGDVGVLVASASVLRRYPDVNDAFIESHGDAVNAKGVIDRLQGGLPRRAKQWQEAFDAFEKLRASREIYMNKVQEKLDERKRLVASVLDGGRLKSLRMDLHRAGQRHQFELAAFLEVRKQIYAQESRLRSGERPVLEWPAGGDRRWLPVSKELEDSLVISSRSLDAWKDLERRLESAFRTAEAVTRDSVEFSDKLLRNLRGLESAFVVERQILAAAEDDLAANVLLQQVVDRRERLLKRDYERWKQAQK